MPDMKQISDIDILSIPNRVFVRTNDGEDACTLSDNEWRLGDVRVTFDRGKVSLTAGNTGVRYIKLIWNGSFAGSLRFLGDAFERNYGTLEWRCSIPFRQMPWYFIASDGVTSRGFGVKTGPDAIALWMQSSEGITLLLDTRCGGLGVRLSGRTMTACELVTAGSKLNEDPFDFCCRFCSLMCTAPRMPAFPVYGSNNWYYAYGRSSAQEILRDTDILASLTEGLNDRPFMVIDDCWQKLSLFRGAAGRPYDCGNMKFPDMKGLCGSIKKKGVRPGIWCRPLFNCCEELPQDAPEDLFSDRSGLNGNREFDITSPEALELISEDISRLVSWGYELIKFDYATYDIYGIFEPGEDIYSSLAGHWLWQDRAVTNAQAIKNFYRTVRKAAGDALLIGCNVIGHLAAGIIDIQRSGDDTSGKQWQRTVRMGVNTLAYRLPQNGNFFAVDADCVGITKNIPWGNNREFLRLLSVSGTPLFCSIAPDALDDTVRSDLKRAFALGSEQKNTLKPLDWMDSTIPENYLVDGKVTHFRFCRDLN